MTKLIFTRAILLVSSFSAYSASVSPISYDNCGTKVTISMDDILKQDVDAIVNPANMQLTNAGGLARVIAVAAGDDKLQDYYTKNFAFNGKYMNVGDALLSPSFNLALKHTKSIKYIVNSVGPNCNKPAENAIKKQLLERVYINSLQAASLRPDINSIAFPTISTGIFGYEPKEAAPVAISAINAWVRANPGRFKEIRIVAFDPVNFDSYASLDLGALGND